MRNQEDRASQRRRKKACLAEGHGDVESRTWKQTDPVQRALLQHAKLLCFSQALEGFEATCTSQTHIHATHRLRVSAPGTLRTWSSSRLATSPEERTAPRRFPSTSSIRRQATPAPTIFDFVPAFFESAVQCCILVLTSWDPV